MHRLYAMPASHKGLVLLALQLNNSLDYLNKMYYI